MITSVKLYTKYIKGFLTPWLVFKAAEFSKIKLHLFHFECESAERLLFFLFLLLKKIPLIVLCPTLCKLEYLLWKRAVCASVLFVNDHCGYMPEERVEIIYLLMQSVLVWTLPLLVYKSKMWKVKLLFFVFCCFGFLYGGFFRNLGFKSGNICFVGWHDQNDHEVCCVGVMLWPSIL